MNTMSQNLELEFKCFISEAEYNRLMNEFDLNDNVFSQTNHYFDTDDFELHNSNIVLRIREKGPNFKLTKKVRAKEQGSIETHVFLTPEEAKKMLEEGFDASIIGINKKVHYVCHLTTYRARTPYGNGTLFLDKSVYYGHTDYELEFEADEWTHGKEEFKKFLKARNIKQQPVINKSTRAFNACNL